MRHTCTQQTDLDELIGIESFGAFQYGPLSCALRNDEELVLENSASLSHVTRYKIQALIRGLFIPETEERFLPGDGFRLILQ